MSFKDVVKDTIKIGGCMGILVISGAFVALKAYHQGYLVGYKQASSLIDETIDREIAKAMAEESR